jgi:ribosomal protein L7/L12
MTATLVLLADLLDRDLITRDEFDRQKERVLAASAESAPPGNLRRYSVVLDDTGDKRVQVISEICSVTGIGLKPAAYLVRSAPSTVLYGADLADASLLQRSLTKVGAVARIVEVKLPCGGAAGIRVIEATRQYRLCGCNALPQPGPALGQRS